MLPVSKPEAQEGLGDATQNEERREARVAEQPRDSTPDRDGMLWAMLELLATLVKFVGRE